MLVRLRQLLSYEFTVAELIGLAIILAIPYLVIGVIWVFTHTDRLQGMHGIGLVVSFLASIVSWPVLLLLPNVCMA